MITAYTLSKEAQKGLFADYFIMEAKEGSHDYLKQTVLFTYLKLFATNLPCILDTEYKIVCMFTISTKPTERLFFVSKFDNFAQSMDRQNLFNLENPIYQDIEISYQDKLKFSFRYTDCTRIVLKSYFVGLLDND